MDIILQVSISIFAISYKYFLSRNNIFGWIFSMISGLLSLLYLFIYLHLPILMCLEGSFFLLAIYGTYKHTKNATFLTKTDLIIICLTIIVISFLIFLQLKSHTVWYEVIASVSFLGGLVLLAQKYSICKIAGWLFFFAGSLFYGYLMLQKGAYVLSGLHLVSMVIDAYALYAIAKKRFKRQLI